jgi:hypothetical protein
VPQTDTLAESHSHPSERRHSRVAVVVHTDSVVAATPVVAIERSFEHHGVAVSQVSAAPELCNSAACTGVAIWGASGRVVYPDHAGVEIS